MECRTALNRGYKHKQVLREAVTKLKDDCRGQCRGCTVLGD